MLITRTQTELRAATAAPPVLVPTMGGLHAGHTALAEQGVREAARRGGGGGRGGKGETRCVVTVFVNPTQFDVPADFDRYPRHVEADAAILTEALTHSGLDPDSVIIYAPPVSEVYPEGPREAAAALTEADLPPQATGRGLEDAFRPGHFRGVVLVLSRLYHLTQPAAAIYGEKDWQQLQVARAMAPQRSDGSPIDILGGPTVRDTDGLALSSRNRFLSPEQRQQALAIPRALTLAGAQPTPAAAEQAMRDHLRAAGLTPNYATVRNAETLLPLAPDAPAPGRALLAAPLGEGARAVRLLDNLPWLHQTGRD